MSAEQEPLVTEAERAEVDRLQAECDGAEAHMRALIAAASYAERQYGLALERVLEARETTSGT